MQCIECGAIGTVNIKKRNDMSQLHRCLQCGTWHKVTTISTAEALAY